MFTAHCRDVVVFETELKLNCNVFFRWRSEEPLKKYPPLNPLNTPNLSHNVYFGVLCLNIDAALLSAWQKCSTTSRIQSCWLGLGVKAYRRRVIVCFDRLVRP